MGKTETKKTPILTLKYDGSQSQVKLTKLVPNVKARQLSIEALGLTQRSEGMDQAILDFFGEKLSHFQDIIISYIKLDTLDQCMAHVEILHGAFDLCTNKEFAEMFRASSKIVTDEGKLILHVPAVLTPPKKDSLKGQVESFLGQHYIPCSAIDIKSQKPAKPRKKKAESTGNADSGAIYGKMRGYETVNIDEIDEFTGNVSVCGHILKIEDKDFRDKTGKIVLIDITDYTSSITGRFFLKQKTGYESLDKLKKGMYVRMDGTSEYNGITNEVVIKIAGMEEEACTERMDTAEEKRVELHLHSKMSSMDSLTDLKSAIARAAKWGHKAMAITDHGVVQAYPDAASAAGRAGIKMLYGLECYLHNDGRNVVTGETDININDSFTVFDVETTGLDGLRDAIIEIAAVRVRKGAIADTYHSLINPKRDIPSNITQLTGISNEKVADAPEMREVMERFIEFVGDDVVCAHNADFDMGFIQNTMNRLGMKFAPTYLDTLELSRRLIPKVRSYKLGSLCKKLKIKLVNAHQALDDTTATAKLLIKLFQMVKAEGITEIGEINTKLTTDNINRGDVYHTILFPKNKKGLKELYKMVSISHLEHLTRGKPHIPKSVLAEMRDDILVGSACEAGELYQAILWGASPEKAREVASFYDFLEVQPLGNNEFLVREGKATRERLIEINREIIAIAKEQGKLVVATGDVHFLEERDEYFRRILMHGQKFDDADNQAPLYFRTTQEMLDEFYYLSEEEAKEIVITNTNLIADMIEDMEPLPEEKLYAPHIDGAKDEVINMTYKTAKSIYGDNLPEIVVNRLEKELSSIVGYGYSVLYLIASKLVLKSNADGYLVGSRGSVGSSLVATMTGITEVNPLPPHYTCDECFYSDFEIDIAKYGCGPDLPDKICPNCGRNLTKRGYDIPFEVFLGFKGDKVPDIDLNFSGENQSSAHKYTEVLLGKDNVFRAGTISTLAERTAFGFVKNYLDEKGLSARRAELDRLVTGCSGVKRTTGQHPGGIIVVPDDMDIHDFSPIQYPADDKTSGTITTHFDFNSLHDRLVKLDILGHDDPTMLKMLSELTGLEAVDIPLDDQETMSIFSSTDALGVTPEVLRSKMGTYGIPEFGTRFVRQMLEDTMPTTMSELIRISGLSHGTDVWLGNAQELIKNGTATLMEAICTRDDIMNALIYYGVEPKIAFDTMESVRKGRGLKDEMEKAMLENNVPDWFINSCKLIKYMFPKGHAVAYVTMGFRVAYYKVHYPVEYYTTYYTVRADEFDASIMLGTAEQIKAEIIKYEEKIQQNGPGGGLSAREKKVLTILEIVYEMNIRGISFLPIDLYRSHANRFTIVDGKILPPFTALPGLGGTVAQSIMEDRVNGPFTSIKQLQTRTKANKSVVAILQESGCLQGIPETDQVSMFELVGMV